MTTVATEPSSVVAKPASAWKVAARARRTAREKLAVMMVVAAVAVSVPRDSPATRESASATMVKLAGQFVAVIAKSATKTVVVLRTATERTAGMTVAAEVAESAMRAAFAAKKASVIAIPRTATSNVRMDAARRVISA